MNILGISAYMHESSACLLKDGVPAALVEEERLNREKHTDRFPENAVREVLRIGGVSAAEIDHVTFYWQPWQEIRGNVRHFLRYFPESLRLLSGPSGARELSFLERSRLQRNIGERLRRSFPGLERAGEVRYLEHHLCHAASAFFASPFERAAILTLDGRGEDVTTLWAEGAGLSLSKLHAHPVPHSLGHLYSAVTDHLGFNAFHDEWKVMGLAAYGTDRVLRDFGRLLRVSPEGEFRLDLDYFAFHTHGRARWLSPRFASLFGPARPPSEKIDQRHCDLAYALQKSVELAGLEMARALHRRTGSPNLCLAGGVALNCLMNKAIVEQGPFREVFIQPLAHDAGAAMGSALLLQHQILKQPRKGAHGSLYLGPSYSDEEIRAALDRAGLSYERRGDIALKAADAVSRGRIVGWFQGRMEAGPRALGNRSILADARLPGMKDLLNSRIKRREWFRPFAPAVTIEAARDFFALKQDSPHMILAADVRMEKRSLIPAAVHRDGTARVQTVSRTDNPRFWELLDAFGKLTGVPVVLNTSFNENEPIVCTPEHAVDCFVRTGMDVLAIGDFLVERRAP